MGWKSLQIDNGTGWKEIHREAGTGWKALEWAWLINWDFEDDTIGQTPTGWTVNAGGTLKVVSGKAAQLDQVSSGTNAQAYKALVSISTDNIYTIELDMTSKSATGSTYGYIVLRPTMSNTSAIYLGVRNTGFISYYSGGWTNLVAYTTDTKNTIKIYNIDFTNHQFDIDINDVNRGTNCGFSNNHNSIGYLSLEASHIHFSTLLDYDNIKQYET